jgi:hypothetical protein
MLRSILQIEWRQHILNIELHRRAGVLFPAAQITRRTLKFVGSILAGPPQVAKTLLKWQHNYTRRRQYKRRLSYPEHWQIRHMTGEREALSPTTKKARLLEIMDYLPSSADSKDERVDIGLFFSEKTGISSNFTIIKNIRYLSITLERHNLNIYN